MITSVSGGFLVLDVRNEQKRTVRYFTLNLLDHQLTELPYENLTWWSSLEAYHNGVAFISEYLDQKDPTKKGTFLLGEEKEQIGLEQLPVLEQFPMHPYLYEDGTDYHQTVSSFLSLELPLSCEYLEHEENIILSYYLRSGKVFNRFLLVLKEGKKYLKETQDVGIKGFAAGAFFVLDGNVFYVKNGNEICIYPL